MVLCGDFDPDQALQLAQKFFGGFMPKKKPVFRFTPQPELASRIHKDVLGTESPWVEIAWRVDGAKSNDAMLAPIVSGILYNGAVGLIDEYIMQEQRLLEAYAFPRTYEDYGSFYCYGKPREGQTHADVERILMAEVDRLRRGEFHDWLPQAVIKNMKLSEARQFEKNEGRAGALTSAYVLGLDWGEFTKRWKKWETSSIQQQYKN